MDGTPEHLPTSLDAIPARHAATLRGTASAPYGADSLAYPADGVGRERMHHEAVIAAARLGTGADPFADAARKLLVAVATPLVALVSRVADRSDVVIAAIVPYRAHRGDAATAGGRRTISLSASVDEKTRFSDLAGWLKAAAARQFADGPTTTPHRYDAILDLTGERASVPDSKAASERSASASTGDGEPTLRFSLLPTATPGQVCIAVDIAAEVAFASGGAAAVSSHFLSLLDASVRTREFTIAAAPLCRGDDAAAALRARTAPPPPFATLLDAFDAHAGAADAVALSEGERSMRYGELAALVAAAARGLVAAGIAPGRVVALAMPRSTELVVAMLATLRAGAAFCVFDHDAPDARAAAMLATIGARLVVTRRGAKPGPGFDGVPRVELDDLAALGEGSTAPLAPASPDAVAYHIFTSGSTGTPNAVSVPHRSLARFLHWHHIEVLGGGRPTCAFTAAPAFDASLRMLTGFWSGGSVRVYVDAGKGGMLPVAAAIAEDACDTAIATPSQLRVLIASGHLRPTRRLRDFVVMGEPLPRELALQTEQALGPQVRLWNAYGPTEAIMASTHHRFDPQRDAPAKGLSPTVPVGLPAPDVSIHVLDGGLNPVPPGVIGEVWIGGERLALGYADRPALTAERFRPSPFIEGARMYRTGDFGRRAVDGTLVLSGRRDEQVKIGGLRIELAEVERALASHPLVLACAAAVIGEAAPRLIGWYVATRDIPPTELRAAMARLVPQAMIPSRFVRIPSIPLTARGKTDRRALPYPAYAEEPTSAATGRRDDDLPAMLRHERAIAAICTDMLGADIGPTEDLRERGADSLALVQILHAVEDLFDVTLSFESLERLTTVSALAGSVRAAQRARRRPAPAARDDKAIDDILRQLRSLMESAASRPIGRDGLVRLANGAGSRPPLMWCFNSDAEFRAMAAQLGDDQPLYGMRSLNKIKVAPQERAAVGRRLAGLYAGELLNHADFSRCAVGGNCQSASIAMTLATALQQAGRNVDLLMMLEKAPPVPYAGRVALFFGRDSVSHNAFRRFAAPEAGWLRFYREVVHDIIPGAHGQFFREPNIGPFAERVASRMREAFGRQPLRMGPAERAASLSFATAPEPLVAGTETAISVTVENRGTCRWQPGRDGGLSLAGRWTGDRDGRPQTIGLDTAVFLPRGLDPGDAYDMVLPVRVPPLPGRWTLEIELCEEGIAWFSEDGTTPLRQEVEVVAAAPESRILRAG